MMEKKFTRKEMENIVKQQMIERGILVGKSIENEVVSKIVNMLLDSSKVPLCCIDKVFEEQGDEIIKLVRKTEDKEAVATH